LRCGRCGNENDGTNRFCGMCGAALVAGNPPAGQAVEVGPAAGAAGSVGAVAERKPTAVSGSEARSEAWPSSRPVISGGPSLLGLNLPGSDAGSGRGDGGRDPLRPSSSVEYLLEDDEEPRRSRGKLILVAAAMALAVGFGYLHWKGVGGFDWISGGDKKPAAVAVQSPDAGQSGAASQDGVRGGGSVPAGAAGGPAESGAPQTAVSPTASQDTSSQGGSQGGSQGAPAQSAPAPSGAAAQDAALQSTDQQSTDQQSTDQQSTPRSDARESGAAASPAAGSDSDQQAPVQRAAARKPAASKPAAGKPAPANAVDSVTEAERYIYGRGVGQDCDRGLRLLKPAAGQSNVRAMISLGALYSTGVCTPRDLPTAYRWFALALHKEPDNQALQDDLQNLWSRMTPPERQLAIKLSQ